MSHDRRGRGGRAQAGFTFAELAVGVAIIAVVSAIFLVHLMVGNAATRAHRDKIFAYTTAQSILSELHAVAEGSPAIDLTSYDDGGATSPTLSIATSEGAPVAPDHLRSRNVSADGRWVWSRRISVRPLPGTGSRSPRRISVDVFKCDARGAERPMASLSSIVNSPVIGFPSTQVFDIYFLALENVPGFWIGDEAARPYMESVVRDLEARNPGLRFRTHWITKLSYGRNPVYRPYVNSRVDTRHDIASVYFYPGRLPAGGPLRSYYGADRIAARVLTDDGESNGYHPEHNPHPYALADFYNHAMRLPRERALHELRVRHSGESEPTWRLLLEDLSSNPDRYRHAIIVNLHGELLPLPPLRNYSDAARLPRVLPGVRVVTHPEQLRTERPTGSLPGEDVVLRVYAYTSEPGAYRGPALLPAEHPIAIDVVGLDLTDGGGPRLRPGVRIQNLRGGVEVDGDDRYRPFTDARLIADPDRRPGEMGYRAELLRPTRDRPAATRITLFHTPVVAPMVNGRGLAASRRARLYGLEYVPACTEPELDFSRDLYAEGGGPKNTARWTIRIPVQAFAEQWFVDRSGNRYRPAGDVRLTVRTAIRDESLAEPDGAGAMYPVPRDPESWSETYTWWADSADDVPVTERSQFLGDPRHNPYRDLLRGDPDFSDGYNWYHDALEADGENAVADFPGLDPERLDNRYDNRVRADVPRFLQVLREGLVRSATVFTAPPGWSYYYVGFGNEIGADERLGYPDSLPMDLRPYGEPGGTGTVNNVAPREAGGNTGGRRLVRDGRPDPEHWWGMPWLGELYPDRVYLDQWIATDAEGRVNGNLRAGRGPEEFQRRLAPEVHGGSRLAAWGTRLDRSLQRSDRRACASALNTGSLASTFMHRDAPGPGRMSAAGVELARSYRLDLPDGLRLLQPFELAGSGTNRDFSLAPYNGERFRATLLRSYYEGSDGLVGSGLLQLADPGDRVAGYHVVHGIDPDAEAGPADLARLVIAGATHALLEAGDSAVHRIPRTPRVTIQAPTELSDLVDPTRVQVRFDVKWLRWDGRPYTAATPPGFAEREHRLDYMVYYSPDRGASWYHVQDGSPARPGTPPGGSRNRHGDAGPGPETVVWTVPAERVPRGHYTLRVEVFRRDQRLHYAYHQVRAFIERTGGSTR